MGGRSVVGLGKILHRLTDHGIGPIENVRLHGVVNRSVLAASLEI